MPIPFSNPSNEARWAPLRLSAQQNTAMAKISFFIALVIVMLCKIKCFCVSVNNRAHKFYATVAQYLCSVLGHKIKFIENSDESTLNTLARFLENDEEASELLKNGFPLEMILNCVRNGVFNMNVAEAITYILEQTKDWTFELLNPEYLNNIINLIDTEDHYFEEDILDLVRFLIQKEHDGFEDKHEKIYEILSFAQSNYNEKNIKVLQKMATFKFISFDEIEKLLDVLLHFTENNNKKAMKKMDKIVQEYKEKYGGLEKTKRIFLSFFEPYLKNNFK